MSPGLLAQEDARAAALLSAQEQAERLFAAIGVRGLIRPGVSELTVSKEIHALAAELLGVRRHWHKRIVRAGANTLQPYSQNPPDRMLAADDICFLDLGPVFEEWEADLGRTYVLGKDPVKLRLRDDVEALWLRGREHFEADRDITGAQLYSLVCAWAVEAGWEFGADMAGHLVGEFPHASAPGTRSNSRIAATNHEPMRGLDENGQVRHWILELHLVHRERRIGAFHEQLLDL